MHVNFLSGSEKITISGDLEHGYFINYELRKINGYWLPTYTSARYNTFFDAHRALKKYKPNSHAYGAESLDGLDTN